MAGQQWWCLDCRVGVELNSNGKCGVCDSDAVDVMVETDDCSEMLAVLPPATSGSDAQPLFMKLGVFLRFAKSSPASLPSSSLRPASQTAHQMKSAASEAAGVN